MNMNIGISAQTNPLLVKPSADEPAMLTKILSAIAEIESGSNDYPNNGKARHKDKVSWGRYGVTMTAVRELQRNDLIDCHFHEKWLANPATNEIAAAEYLKLMFRKYKCWYKAAGAYHSQTVEFRDEYAYKVFCKIMEEPQNNLIAK